MHDAVEVLMQRVEHDGQELLAVLLLVARELRLVPFEFLGKEQHRHRHTAQDTRSVSPRYRPGTLVWDEKAPLPATCLD